MHRTHSLRFRSGQKRKGDFWRSPFIHFEVTGVMGCYDLSSAAADLHCSGCFNDMTTMDLSASLLRWHSEVATIAHSSSPISWACTDDRDALPYGCCAWFPGWPTIHRVITIRGGLGVAVRGLRHHKYQNYQRCLFCWRFIYVYAFGIASQVVTESPKLSWFYFSCCVFLWGSM